MSSMTWCMKSIRTMLVTARKSLRRQASEHARPSRHRQILRGNRILDGISIEAAEGEFIALVGPSGCGKSTLLRILAGLDHADEGSVELAGRNITGAHPADRNIAMVFQSYALYPHLTTAQNIAVPLAMRDLTAVERLPMIGTFVPGQRRKRAAIQKQVRATATSLKIDHLLDRKPGQMSGGQRQRVALPARSSASPVHS